MSAATPRPVSVVLSDGRRFSGRISTKIEKLPAETSLLRVNRPLAKMLADYEEKGGGSLLAEDERRKSVEYAEHLIYLQNIKRGYEENLPKSRPESIRAVDRTFYSFPQELGPAVETHGMPPPPIEILDKMEAVGYESGHGHDLGHDHGHDNSHGHDHVHGHEHRQPDCAHTHGKVEHHDDEEKASNSDHEVPTREREREKARRRSTKGKSKSKSKRASEHSSRAAPSAPTPTPPPPPPPPAMPKPLAKPAVSPSPSPPPPEHDYNVWISRSKAPAKCSLFLPGSSNVYVDLRSQCPPVSNQGSVASSAAHALCAAYEYAVFSEFRASVHFAHYNERMVPSGKHPGHPSNFTIENALSCMQRTGICSEALYPSVAMSEMELAPPTKKHYDDASKRQIEVNRIKNDRAAIRKCLASNFPIVTAVTVFKHFESPPESSGIVPLPGPKERSVSNPGCGQAILLVGFDDECEDGVWIVRNSVGTAWGIEGHAYLPYGYEDYFSGLYVLTPVE